MGDIDGEPAVFHFKVGTYYGTYQTHTKIKTLFRQPCAMWTKTDIQARAAERSERSSSHSIQTVTVERLVEIMIAYTKKKVRSREHTTHTAVLAALALAVRTSFHPIIRFQISLPALCLSPITQKYGFRARKLGTDFC